MFSAIVSAIGVSMMLLLGLDDYYTYGISSCRSSGNSPVEELCRELHSTLVVRGHFLGLRIHALKMNSPICQTSMNYHWNEPCYNLISTQLTKVPLSQWTMLAISPPLMMGGSSPIISCLLLEKVTDINSFCYRQPRESGVGVWPLLTQKLAHSPLF